MAEVTSFTKERILELFGVGADIEATQAEVLAALAELKAELEKNNAYLTDLNQQTLPKLQQDLSESNNRVSDLNDNVLPNLADTLADNEALLEDMNTVTLPLMQSDLYAGLENARALTMQFFSDEPPESTEDRDLQVGDVWYDTNDGNRTYKWTGTEWSTYSINVSDLVVSVKQFKSGKHLIY